MIHYLEIIETKCIYVCVCDYTTEKYKRKMCYLQKNNSNVEIWTLLL